MIPSIKSVVNSVGDEGVVFDTHRGESATSNTLIFMMMVRFRVLGFRVRG